MEVFTRIAVMDNVATRGSLVAIVTPMRENGELDLEGFHALIDFHVAEGTDGIVVVGTTGESPTVDFDEHNLLIRTAVEGAAGRVPHVEPHPVGDVEHHTAKIARPTDKNRSIRSRGRAGAAGWLR